MGNNAGKDAQKPTEIPNTGIPEIQKAEEKAREAVQAIKTDPTVKKVEEKSKQAVDAIKSDPRVQKVQEQSQDLANKAKHALDQAKQNIDLHKVENKAKELTEKAAEKAKEVTEKAKEGVNIAEIEGKAKDTLKDITNTLSTFSRDSSTYLKDAEKFSTEYYGIVKNEVRNINRDAPVYISNFKRDYIFPVDPSIRAAGFYGLTALTFLISIKARAGLFSTIRNTAFIGLTTGFFVHPESLNPFRFADREINEQDE
jgi:hypothetical protein